MTLNCTLYKWLKWPQIGGYFHTYTQHRRKHGGKQTPTDVSTEVGDKDRYRSKRVYEFSCENRNSSASPAESESLEIGILLLLSALYSSYPVFNVLHDLVLGLPTQHITTMNNPPQLSHAPHQPRRTSSSFSSPSPYSCCQAFSTVQPHPPGLQGQLHMEIISSLIILPS